MIKFIYPNGTHCYRSLQTVHAIFRDDENRLIARAEKGDRSDYYEFEIRAFELLAPGGPYS
ncbi:MAG: hypothetical protein AAFU55_02030 [Pseudomonadota bacterium]